MALTQAEQTRDRTQGQMVAATQAALSEVDAALEQAVLTRDQVAENVADPQTLLALAEAIESAGALPESVEVVEGSPVHLAAAGADRPAIDVDTVVGTDPSLNDVRAVRDALTSATDAVAASHRAWAVTKLDEEIARGQTVLEGSAGAVLDEATRTNLQSALDAARVVAADETSTASHVLTTATGLPEAITAVTTSQAGWQAEQDRLAAEAAQAELERQAAANRPTPRPQTSGQSSGSGSGSQNNTGNQSNSGNQGNGGNTSSPPPVASGRVTSINVTNASASSSSPGSASFTVNVATSGDVSTSIKVSIGGRSATLGHGGGGTYSGTVTGVPAGSHGWTVTAGGLSASGSLTVY